MGSITRNLKEVITHWSATPDGFGGYVFGPPDNEMLARWEERAEVFLDVRGNEQVSNAVVFLSKDVEVEDFLYRGETTEVDPTTLMHTFPVRRFTKMPDLRYNSYERVAYL